MKFKIGDKVIRTDGLSFLNNKKYAIITSICICCNVEYYGVNDCSPVFKADELELMVESEG